MIFMMDMLFASIRDKYETDILKRFPIVSPIIFIDILKGHTYKNQ